MKNVVQGSKGNVPFHGFVFLNLIHRTERGWLSLLTHSCNNIEILFHAHIGGNLANAFRRVPFAPQVDRPSQCWHGNLTLLLLSMANNPSS